MMDAGGPTGAQRKIKARFCSGLTFSPDSRRLVYVLSALNEAFLVLDGQQHGPERQEIVRPKFSPGCRILAYIIYRKDKVFMITNENEGKAYDSIWHKTLAFSADEKQVTYVAQEGSKLYLVTQTVD